MSISFPAAFEEQSKTFTIALEEQCKSFETEFSSVQIIGGGGDPYEGEYDITPKKNKQTMATRGKVMSDDVTILAIPYAEVTNATGGQTVTIG